MTRKVFLKPFPLFEDGDLSGSLESSPVNIETIDNVGITVTTSDVSDNKGTFTIQVRNGEKDDWQDLALDTPMVLNDTDAQFNVNLNQIPFTQIRLTFEPQGTSPDGTVNAWIAGKGV